MEIENKRNLGIGGKLLESRLGREKPLSSATAHARGLSEPRMDRARYLNRIDGDFYHQLTVLSLENINSTSLS